MKNRLIPLLMLLLATTLTAKANPVDMQTAREVAVKFVNANTRTPLRGTEDLQLVTTYRTESDDAAFHIFNTPNGFVIVSADDCATPILGYSDEGRPFDLDDIPIQLQEYLQGFVEQIQYGIENHVHDETTAQQWELVKSTGRLNDNRDGEAVEPLITSMWGQGWPYNAMCPIDSLAGATYHYRCLTGCVATSFAQIMHYWGYPINGMGSHSYTPDGYPEQTVNFSATTYDWANMPNSLSSSSSSTQIDAVATLMWHCGVAVNMGYGPDASGAVSTNVATALQNYFGYSDELSIVYRSNYNDADWLALMKNCLDSGCPIHYSGSNAYGSGHAFVCDGYNSNDLLHFNWGWNGYHNGYFSIGALNPGGHSYNSSNKAIINIHPGCTYGTTYQITVTTESSVYGTVSGSGTYSCGNVCTVTATANAGYGFMYWTENDEPVSTDANYSFIAMNDRDLVAHFGPPFNITTSANPPEGGTVTGGGTCYYNQHVTLTAVPNEGYVFDKWTKDGVDFSYYSTLNMNVTEAAEYVAYFEPLDGIEIGVAMSTNAYLPTYSHHSLTQQIYTAEEMGGETCEISSVSFFNTGTSTSCNLAIYMVNTDKTVFNSTNDWITVTEANQVFSGSVTMAAKSWTTIYFPTPFSYNGSSNVALIIDNNAVTYNYGNVFCRTFSTNEYQAICINSFNTNYDPYNPSAYTGTRIKYKNHVVFGIPNYDYTVTATVNPANCGTVSGGGSCYLNQPITLTATPNAGYVFKNWTKNGTVVSYLSTYSLTVTESAEYVANFEVAPNGIVIGNSTNTSYYLPTYYNNYSLSEQIYTADEMGGTACQISSVSFFNTGTSPSFNLAIYMVNTDKTAFNNANDWIAVTEANQVFSGSVTMTEKNWTTIYFATPFYYDGSSNVALIIDNNSNSYTDGYANCRTFSTDENQAIRIYSYGTNYDPYNPSIYTGLPMNVKNQVIFGIPSYDYTVTATTNTSNSGTVSGGGSCYFNQTITLTATPNANYVFNNWTKNGTVVSYLSTYTLTVTESAEYVANFQEVTNGIAIGNATYTNSYLPINSYYSLSEQIYTANEMGGAATEISSVSFFNVSNYNSGITRNLSIYMVNTDKTSFEDTSDWIPVSDDDLVFSGNVNFTVHDWVTIHFNTPFNYDGTSNVALIVDDNSNNSNSTTSCRTFMTGGNQAIRIYGSGTNYDPTYPSSYTGTLMSMKNQVMFGMPSYGYTITATANPSNGGTVSGGGSCYLNQPITLTATSNSGYVFNNWTKDGEVVSYLSTFTLTVTESAEYVANFEEVPNSIVIGSPTNTNAYLPTHSYYSLSEQIYTANEMGGTACQISSVSFFNTGTAKKNRTMNVYMVSTDKTVFDSVSDWIPVSESDLVYSGTVVIPVRNWTTIYFSTPFNYDGSSNVALIVDDNSNSYNTSTSCRTFVTGGNQTIRISGSGTNCDPTNPSGNTGTLMSMKNQVVFGIPSYDYTVTVSVGSDGGGTVSGGGLCYLNQPITLTATPNEGYVFKYWTKNGTVVSCLSTYTLTVTESAEYVANFQEIANGFVIGDATYTNSFLPINSYYSLSEQIFTANEMGGTACQISSVSFFNTGASRPRTISVYMVSTDKTVFDSVSDWIPVSESDLVYSGSVVIPARDWATIYFSTPFNYDGSSNVALIVDDDSNSNNSSTSFRSFVTEGNQAIRIYGSGTNYDPTNPSGYTGTLMSMKNQVIFRWPSTVTATANPTGGGTVSGYGSYAYGTTCTLTATPNVGYYFLNWTENGTVVSYDASYSFTVDGDRNLVANFVEGESTCTIVFDLRDSYHNGWSGNYLVVNYSDGSSEQFTLESGSSISYSREVATGSTIALSWITGSNTYQCSFDIKFENGVPIYHGSGLNSGFQQELYINCAVATAPHVITAVAEPEEGGTIEGAGTYDGGTAITLTATPNDGYSFCFWSENGQQVSTDASYSFIVTSDRDLLARFSLPLNVSATTNMALGGTVTGYGMFYYGNTCTLTATPNEGYLFLNWSKNGEVVSCKATYSFTVTEDTDLEAVFMRLEGTLIGQGEATNNYLPSYSGYNYTLSQQIYTPNEIGEAGNITSISYFNGGTTKTRTYDIYMVHTDKTTFENATDWITVSEADLVYSGSVTITQGYWTTIDLDTPFAYNGTSNLAIIVEDNTRSKSSGMACRVFNSNGNQAIRVCSNGINYDPYDPSGYNGTRYSVKNQIILGFTSSQTFTKEINAYTENGGYYLISVPVDEVAPEEVEHMLDNDYDLYAFDESQELEWINYKHPDNGFANLVTGKGYLYANSEDVVLTLTGVPYNGDGEVILSKTGDAETAGWNLVGNPFADTAYLDRDFYVMNDDGSGIVAADRDYVNVMEGVFVVATENGETLTFSTTEPAKSPRLVINLNSGHLTSSGTAIIDRAIIRFTKGRMLPKLQIKENNSKLFIKQDGKDYAVVNSDNMGEMQVDFKAEQSGTYTLSFINENVDFSYLHLMDTLTGTDIDLLQQSSYTFSASAQAGERQFKLLYKQSEK